MGNEGRLGKLTLGNGPLGIGIFGMGSVTDIPKSSKTLMFGKLGRLGNEILGRGPLGIGILGIGTVTATPRS